jgi:hypothetical protein
MVRFRVSNFGFRISNLEFRCPVGRSTAALIATVAAALGIVLGVWVWVLHTRSVRPQPRAPLTAEERAYLPHIEVKEAKVSAASNFLGDMVTYVDAKVTNAGPRPVRQVDLRLEFRDMLNQAVLRDSAHPITERMPPLEPGETREVRMTFEKLPVEWNQASPAITPVGLRF